MIKDLLEINKGIVRNTQLDNIDYTDKRRTTSLVLDVETTFKVTNKEVDKNSVAIFDVGYTVCSIARESMILHRSYIVSDIFLDMNAMERAYYFEKYPSYVYALAKQQIDLVTFNEFIKILNEDIENYNVKEMYAYNSKFDSGAITNTNKLINDLSDLKYDIKCLWEMSANTFMQSDEYIQMALDNNWLTPTGNISTGAEFAYRFITNDLNFVEKHTGLEDSIIETQILFYIKHFATKGKIKSWAPWHTVKLYSEDYAKRKNIVLPNEIYEQKKKEQQEKEQQQEQEFSSLESLGGSAL